MSRMKSVRDLYNHIGYVVLYAPDRFPIEDYLPADEQMTLEKAFEQKTGKALPINVDGAIAAVISDMGFDWRLGKGFFIISRMPGLLAHAYEEMTREKPMRKLGPMPFGYDGPADRVIDSKRK